MIIYISWFILEKKNEYINIYNDIIWYNYINDVVVIEIVDIIIGFCGGE